MSRILLLETDKYLAGSLEKFLASSGHQVDWQVDLQEAIISIDVQPVDMVIMDIMLAGRSGIEFLYEFRSYPDWSNIPVIIYSNVPSREIGISVAGFNQLGIRNYFYKPTTPISQVVDSVNSFVAVV
jgi:DNA-binding response OmpR family regulator